MKLATIHDGTPDGRLVIVSEVRGVVRPAQSDARNLREALELWNEVEPSLFRQAAELEQGASAEDLNISEVRFLAPLPRAWQWLDGSTYLSHAMLMEKAYDLPIPQRDVPLMYQGLSHQFLGHREDAIFRSEDDGIDFEGEFGVITDFVPMGTSPSAAIGHIKLLIQINDWSLRTLGAAEMATGFGFLRSKPACGVAPFAVTPDELGACWRNGRVHLPLHVDWNGAGFGEANGSEMAYGFHDLIAHAASTRSLCGGTIVGSGTVSNEAYRQVGSSCIAERRGIEVIDHGEAKTSYLRFGDTVSMVAKLPDGTAPFGTLNQKVTRSERR